MTRRGFLGRVLAAAGLVCAKPAAWLKAAAPQHAPLRIHQILSASFNAARDAHLRGRTWRSPLLLQAEHEGRLLLRPFGAVVVEPVLVEEIWVSMVWHQRDDVLPKAEKISLVSSLIANAIDATESIIAERLGSGRAVVSQHWKHEAGETQHYPSGLYRKNLYTVIAF